MGSLSLLHWLFVIVVLVICAAINFIPTFVAFARSHHHRVAILSLICLAAKRTLGGHRESRATDPQETLSEVQTWKAGGDILDKIAHSPRAPADQRTQIPKRAADWELY